MSKEMVISANPHETRVAIMEEGLLCEYYVEREKEFALVGSIYKGKVTRVLPGMQSAFVEIGLDSDAFLYVSDFMEEIEELDHVVTTVEDKNQKMEDQGGKVFPREYRSCADHRAVGCGRTTFGRRSGRGSWCVCRRGCWHWARTSAGRIHFGGARAVGTGDVFAGGFSSIGRGARI